MEKVKIFVNLFQVCGRSVHGVLQPDIPFGEPAASPHRIHASYPLIENINEPLN
jgi:hypothetical protein